MEGQGNLCQPCDCAKLTHNLRVFAFHKLVVYFFLWSFNCFCFHTRPLSDNLWMYLWLGLGDFFQGPTPTWSRYKALCPLIIYLQEYFRYPKYKNLKIIIIVVCSSLKLACVNRTDDYANCKLSQRKTRRSSVLAKWSLTVNCSLSVSGKEL